MLSHPNALPEPIGLLRVLEAVPDFPSPTLAFRSGSSGLVALFSGPVDDDTAVETVRDVLALVLLGRKTFIGRLATGFE